MWRTQKVDWGILHVWQTTIVHWVPSQSASAQVTWSAECVESDRKLQVINENQLWQNWSTTY